MVAQTHFSALHKTTGCYASQEKSLGHKNQQCATTLGTHITQCTQHPRGGVRASSPAVRPASCLRALAGFVLSGGALVRAATRLLPPCGLLRSLVRALAGSCLPRADISSSSACALLGVFLALLTQRRSAVTVFSRRGSVLVWPCSRPWFRWGPVHTETQNTNTHKTEQCNRRLYVCRSVGCRLPRSEQDTQSMQRCMHRHLRHHTMQQHNDTYTATMQHSYNNRTQSSTP